MKGVLVPSFGSFGYYFMMDVVKVSKFAYSMLSVLGFCCLLVGTQLFKTYFKDYEPRTLILFDAALTFVLAPLTFALIFRLNLEYGIPDMALIVFDDVVSSILS